VQLPGFARAKPKQPKKHPKKEKKKFQTNKTKQNHKQIQKMF
jgi:hypothetical protein